MSDFDLAWEFTAYEEGVRKDAQGNITATGLNVTQGDPGGATNFGIAQKFHPDVDVTKLTWDTAKVIAHDQYWVPAGCDWLQWPVNIIVFDTCFNQSLSEAHALSSYHFDWDSILWARLAQYAEKHPENKDFTRWWLLRVLHLRHYIQETQHV